MGSLRVDAIIGGAINVGEFLVEAGTRPIVAIAINPIAVSLIHRLGAVAFPAPLMIASAVGSVVVAVFEAYNRAYSASLLGQLFELTTVVVITCAVYHMLLSGTALGVYSLVTGSAVAVVASLTAYIAAQLIHEVVSEIF